MRDLHRAIAAHEGSATDIGGADLSLVIPRYFHWMLGDWDEGIVSYPASAQTYAATNHVAYLYGRVIRGDAPQSQEWNDAGNAAEAAVRMETDMGRDIAHMAYLAAIGPDIGRLADGFANLAAYQVAQADTTATAQTTAKAVKTCYRQQVNYLLMLLASAPVAQP